MTDGLLEQHEGDSVLNEIGATEEIFIEDDIVILENEVAYSKDDYEKFKALMVCEVCKYYLEKNCNKCKVCLSDNDVDNFELAEIVG